MAKAIGPHSSDTSNTFSFHASTKFCLEPGAQILLRRLTLARRIICKHPWAGQSMQRIINHYAINGTMGALQTDGPRCFQGAVVEPVAFGDRLACPPCGAGGRAIWTSQAHNVQGPVGLLCTSLAEHKGMINSDLAIWIKAGLTFHLQHLPYQQFRTVAEIIATESHFEFLQGSRAIYKNMTSFDKAAHQASIAKLSHEQRGLVIAAQNLTMTSAAKKLAHFGEGNGRCPFCDAANSGILHESWECTAFKEVQQQEDTFLDALTTSNTPHHVLLGIPEQLSLDYTDRVLPSMPGRAIDLIANPDLACNTTIGNEAIQKLCEWASQDSNITATTLAYRLKSHALPPLSLHTSHIEGLPPKEPNTFTDGSVKHPGTAFAQAAFGIVFPARTDDDGAMWRKTLLRWLILVCALMELASQ